MPVFIVRVETEEPEWVPYTWTQRVEADTEEEAQELAEALDGDTLDIQKHTSNTDIENMDRIVNRTSVVRPAADGCTCKVLETCDACIDAGVMD